MTDTRITSSGAAVQYWSVPLDPRSISLRAAWSAFRLGAAATLATASVAGDQSVMNGRAAPFCTVMAYRTASQGSVVRIAPGTAKSSRSETGTRLRGVLQNCVPAGSRYRLRIDENVWG